MKYDFTSILDRRGKDAAAYDNVGAHPIAPAKPKEGFDPIPMWVADMNFATCPAIPAAMIERAKHPLYGYFFPSDAYYNAIIGWQTERNGFRDLKREYIGYENGVHGCVTSAVQTLTAPGDKVLLHSPTYVGFAADVEYLGRTSVYSPLKKDENGIWRMDYEDMDAKLKANNIHLAIFCSPHNPCGRVWERWELERFMELCEKHGVYVVSDEIWSDLILEGHKHIPAQMVNDWARKHTVAVYAPSKTFNLAGLVGSYHIIYCPWLRDRVDKESSLCHYNEMNVLSMHALIGAYKPEGYEWVDELRQVLTGNVNYACDYIAQHFEGVKVSKPQGTYMLFLDCTDWCAKHGKTIDELEKACWDVGVAVQDGRQFHGPCHIRMNLASPLSRIQEAFHRLDKYVFNA